MFNFVMGSIFGSMLTSILSMDGLFHKAVIGNEAQEAVAQCEKSIPRYMTCEITAEIKEAE